MFLPAAAQLEKVDSIQLSIRFEIELHRAFRTGWIRADLELGPITDAIPITVGIEWICGNSCSERDLVGSGVVCIPSDLLIVGQEKLHG